jgi:hypothetical protein
MRVIGLPVPLDPQPGAPRHVAGPDDGFPCRRCLRDAEPGEAVLLVAYDPWTVDSPYRQSGPVFVHEQPCEPWSGAGLPEQQRSRLLSLRGFDADGLPTVAEVLPGTEATARLEQVLGDGHTAFVHLHNAGPGCFAARVDHGR